MVSLYKPYGERATWEQLHAKAEIADALSAGVECSPAMLFRQHPCGDPLDFDRELTCYNRALERGYVYTVEVWLKFGERQNVNSVRMEKFFKKRSDAHNFIRRFCESIAAPWGHIMRLCADRNGWSRWGTYGYKQIVELHDFRDARRTYIAED